ncbi:MAG: hypothetical protein K2Q34_04775, partial [Alphaproteobacteria bacterium]|nr:hypothetical protein [Alphaproteobacteria bacterium]
MITYIIISYISSTTAYNTEELRRSTQHAIDWLTDESGDFNIASARTYLNFTDDSDLNIATPCVQAIRQHFNESLFRTTLEEGDNWDKLDTFFNAMGNLERDARDTPLNLKACHLLTAAVTKSLISLCIKNSPHQSGVDLCLYQSHCGPVTGRVD